MANKTRYILIDWDDREVSTFESKEELTKALDTLASYAGMDLDDTISTEDLECVILKTSCSSKPAREYLELEVKRNWKTI